MSDTYTPADVAKILDTSPATIRRMCEYFADHLSPAATPQKGQPRQFTAEDVHVLQAARLAMNDGKTVDQVNAALQHFALPPEFREPELPAVSPATPDVLILSQRITAVLETMMGHQETYTILAARLEALTAAQEEDTVAHTAQIAALERLARAQEEEATARREQIAAQMASVEIMKEHNASTNRHAAALERLANSIVWVVAALSIIILLTLAVAVGWIG